MTTVKKNYSLKKFTTMRIGGPAKFFVVVNDEDELLAAVRAAREAKMPWTIVGEGSNLIVADNGYKGVVIQNGINRFMRKGRVVAFGAGNNLLNTIFKLDKLELSGMEKMAGIPGTVGGAIYGCAGAYGQEIKDCLVRVRVFDGENLRWITKEQCGFQYRGSIFKKKKNWIIIAAEFQLRKHGKGLMGVSKGIIKLRQKKYPPGLRCPGSFFKNINLADLKPAARKRFLRKIPSDKVMYGKVPAGYLLEEIGAKGMRQGSIRVAGHHANLIYNPGGGRARDVEKLALALKAKVKRKFGIMIEEEVQYL